MSNSKKLKIALVTVTLSDGGAERCAALLSNYFENNNIEVHHIVFSGKIEYDFSGKLFHLIDKKSNNSKLNRLFKLRNYLKKNEFDFIIDFRVKNNVFQELLLNNFIFYNYIQTIHSSKLETYIPKNTFLAKLLYQNCTSIIAVCNEIKQKIQTQYAFKNLNFIYNPIDFEKINTLANQNDILNYNYVVAAGSMNQNIKQFDVLMECYSKSILPKNDIKLLILGDGFLKNKWIKLSEDLGISEMIVFLGNVKNPFQYFKNAQFFVLSSKYEGFPMVLLETLTTGTPVVSYNCESGPAEIIKNNENGILVENQNPSSLTNALNEMVTNKELYLHCKQNAKTSVEPFSIDKIGSQWLELFKQLKNEC